MTGCCAKGCRNSTVKGYVMKRFPRDPDRRTAWARNVNREGWTPTNASCLCEVHFNESQWEDLDWGGTPKLKRTAVPTLFCKCSYGKKRGRNASLLKTANAHVMTEHSYGSVQGIENNQPPNPSTNNSKGKFDRRGDHQYAISAEEGDKKKLLVTDESKKENLSHDESCPLYNSRMRRTYSMDRNNNGDQNNSDSGTVEEIFDCNVEDDKVVSQSQKEATLNFVKQSNQPHKEVTLLKLNTSLNAQSLVAAHAEPMAPVRPKILLLIPEHRSIQTETTILNAAASGNVTDDGSLPVGTKVDSANVIGFGNTSGTNHVQPSSHVCTECNCKKESVDATKLKVAERVLARQSRLVRQVAALQRQHTRQKRTHELEMDKLLKKFHELEEKFDLTRNILRSCVGDDQLTVCATDNSRGVVWSKKTIQKALQLRSSCGSAGYNAISKLLIPLPSERTLQRWNQRSKSHEGVFVEVPKGAFND